MTKQSIVQTGKLSRWYPEKGFGFIIPDTPGNDIFVHRTEVVGQIPLDSKVQYKLSTYNDRVVAIHVEELEPGDSHVS